jgi:hypothetical protein
MKKNDSGASVGGLVPLLGSGWWIVSQFENLDTGAAPSTVPEPQWEDTSNVQKN